MDIKALKAKEDSLIKSSAVYRPDPLLVPAALDKSYMTAGEPIC